MKKAVSTMKKSNYKRVQESAGHDETGFTCRLLKQPGGIKEKDQSLTYGQGPRLKGSHSAPGPLTPCSTLPIQSPCWATPLNDAPGHRVPSVLMRGWEGGQRGPRLGQPFLLPPRGNLSLISLRINRGSHQPKHPALNKSNHPLIKTEVLVWSLEKTT